MDEALDAVGWLIVRDLANGVEREALPGGFHVVPRFNLTAGLTWAMNDTLVGSGAGPTAVEVVRLGAS